MSLIQITARCNLGQKKGHSVAAAGLGTSVVQLLSPQLLPGQTEMDN